MPLRVGRVAELRRGHPRLPELGEQELDLRVPECVDIGLWRRNPTKRKNKSQNQKTPQPSPRGRGVGGGAMSLRETGELRIAGWARMYCHVPSVPEPVM